MPDDKPLELVNDRYWLKRAAEIVTDSARKLDEGAKSIAAAMAWFWTLYSAAATAALAFAPLGMRWKWSILLAAPAMVTFAAYTVATWASLPVDIGFDPRVPDRIKLAHEQAIETKRRRLRISLALGCAAAVLITLALVGIAFVCPVQSEHVGFALAQGSAGTELMVGGTLQTDADVALRVVPLGSPAINRVVGVEKDKAFSISIPVPQAPTYDVLATWVVGGRTLSTRQEVKRP